MNFWEEERRERDTGEKVFGSTPSYLKTSPHGWNESWGFASTEKMKKTTREEEDDAEKRRRYRQKQKWTDLKRRAA